uniref:Uncharacterized protein n=1 Tax=Neobodo designis TaxID=312471 RepID=A0A7S1M4V2_NEODS|mmetsp:Transcript_32828/g.101501  ORF Transcript_32828/g.101501 Transcript_32828/m.101501 type:complete len:222 (+) Transcript_32828:197-862(+)
MAGSDVTAKIVLLGETAVGKSSVAARFVRDEFAQNHESTIGAAFLSHTVQLNEGLVKLEIWDTAGQESFRSITRSYYRGATGTLLVFDVTRRETFEHVASWLHDAQEHSNLPMAILLIGNKSDLADQREVSAEEAASFAHEKGLAYLETSAKTSANVEKAFLDTARAILAKIRSGELDANVMSGKAQPQGGPGYKAQGGQSTVVPGNAGAGGKKDKGGCDC